MDEQLYISRSVYREQFNNLCAEYSIYRLKHNINDEFVLIEKQLWNYRDKAIRMQPEDKTEFDELLCKAQAYLIRKELFAV